MKNRKRIKVVKPVKVDGLSTLDKLAKIVAREQGILLSQAYKYIAMQQELKRIA